MNGFSLQFCAGDNDISGSPTAELDATHAVVWHESGDHIMTLKPAGFDNWEVIEVTESFGQGVEWWLGMEFNSPETAMTEVAKFAEVCQYDVY